MSEILPGQLNCEYTYKKVFLMAPIITLWGTLYIQPSTQTQIRCVIDVIKILVPKKLHYHRIEGALVVVVVQRTARAPGTAPATKICT
jgi:hypothetical protein